MKNIIVVTGGAGFVGSNLIRLFLNKTKFKMISVDNYSSGKISNHINHKRVEYISGNTKNIRKILSSKKNKIHSIFHFGEFARIYQSFLKMEECINSNSAGSNAVFNFCFSNNIKLVYSATSASIGNNGKDKSLSPYAFTKSKNLEFLENLKKWFNFRYDVIFFYNVYGPGHIKKGNMATVIGIFEDHYENRRPLPVVKPGSQSRRFTHIEDTIKVCFKAWKLDKCRFYSVTNKESFSILQVAKLFKAKIKFLPIRRGERYASALSNISLSNKVYKNFGKIRLMDYVNEFIKKRSKY